MKASNRASLSSGLEFPTNILQPTIFRLSPMRPKLAMFLPLPSIAFTSLMVGPFKWATLVETSSSASEPWMPTPCCYIRHIKTSAAYLVTNKKKQALFY